MESGLRSGTTMPLLRAKELSVIIDKAQISAALCSAALQEELENAQKLSPVLQQIKIFNSDASGSVDQLMVSKSIRFTAIDTHAEDVCLISFTSGTTGMPKGTMHFHRDVLAICDCFPRSILQSQASDTFIGTPPLAFTFGLGAYCYFLCASVQPQCCWKSLHQRPCSNLSTNIKRQYVLPRRLSIVR